MLDRGEKKKEPRGLAKTQGNTGTEKKTRNRMSASGEYVALQTSATIEKEGEGGGLRGESWGETNRKGVKPLANSRSQKGKKASHPTCRVGGKLLGCLLN